MAITVWFRGPMLFTRKKVDERFVLQDILLPAAPVRDRFAGDVEDNPNCVPHLAGLLRETGGSWNLDNYDATFTCAEEGTTDADGIGQLISLSGMVSDSKPKLTPVSPRSTNVKTAISLCGGSLSVDVETVTPYDFPPTAFSRGMPSQRVPVFVKWTARSAVTLRLKPRFEGMRSIDVSLADECDVYVYNFENTRPTSREAFLAGPWKGKMDAELTVEPGALTRSVDHDFKWLYWLLTGERLNWTTWRDSHDLPAPECLTHEPTARGASPAGTDCFAAVWDL